MISQKTIRVLVSEPISPVGLEILDEHFEVDYLPECSGEELAEAIRRADALIVRSKTRVTAEIIAAAPRLRVIGRAGVGYDNIDLDFATERGILVMNVPDANTMAATEHTFALMLALMRRIPAADRQMRARKWQRAELVGNELFEKTLGIVGYGRIGREVSVRARAFGMKVLVFDPYVPEDRAGSLGVELVELDPLLARSDVVTLHVPLTDDTRKIIDGRRLGLMKPSAYLINCARGGIVDEEALTVALRDGSLAGAAIDVFPTEPPDFSAPLLASEFPNLLVTPHLGASTEEAQEKVGISIARQVTKALVDEEFANSVNLPRVDPDVLAKLRPFMRLAERMGRFLSGWQPQRVGELELTCEGELAKLDVDYIKRAALKGYLSRYLETPVTYVNAPRLAEQHGLSVSSTRKPGAGFYSSVVTLASKGKGAHHRIAGTLAPSGEPRLVGVDEFDVDIHLEGKMLLIFHRDQPGVIGRVGTILGNSKVNIGRMEVGRRGQGDEAIMLLTVDSDVADRVMANIEELDDTESVRAIEV